MAHVQTGECNNNIRGRACSTALLLLVIACSLTACGVGGAGSANSPLGATPPSPPPPPPPGGDTTPPTAPAGLVAAADGPFRVSLSWQASTDNVGVVGYIVERCQGAGCSAFAQIAAPTGTSFIDTGLAPATSYSYQARASDAARNLSAFSNVASATTAAAPPPLPVVLPDWVNVLAIGAWYQIPNTSMQSIEPSPTPLGTTGPSSKVIAWTSFVVDTRTSKVYSAANGGHADYAGNEVDELDLERAQPVWNPRLGPTPNAQITNCTSYYADGRPASRHSYYGVTLNEFNDRIMLFGGAHWCPPGAMHTAISSYNIGANTWNPSTTHPNLPGAFGDVSAYSRDPSGNVYVARNFQFGRWDRSTNTFTALTPGGSAPPAGDEATSAFDTNRGRILFLGGLANDRHYYTPSSNTWTQITLTGPNAADVSGARGAATVYVEAIDRFLIRFGGSGTTVFQVDPVTFAVTTFATTGGALVPSTQNGPYNKFLYVPRLRGCVYVPSYSGNVWFLRVH